MLWDRRLPAPTAVARTHAERTDSAAKAMVRHYLDSLAALPGGGRVLAPTWKATIGGQEFGLDGTNVTLAGIKFPAFLLGLIPLPVAGNQSEALDVTGQMRDADYGRSMSGQSAAADQQEQIREIRRRQAEAQQLRRMQRDSSAVTP